MNLSQEQINLFKKLVIDRTSLVNALKKSGLIELFISHIVDTYRESAHFVFELLQNADDAKATKAKIVLSDYELTFYHNGTVPFTITDCDTERDPGVRPGHLNSITTFSLSDKPKETDNKIGKFGIGFKSVFQYTNEPVIYNTAFNFRIRQFLIPELVADSNEYNNMEFTTIYRIPFNNPEKAPQAAFAEISEKLQDLQNPLLFLNNLRYFEWEAGGNRKVYTKRRLEKQYKSPKYIDAAIYQLNDLKVLKLTKKLSIQTKEKKYTEAEIAVGFLLTDRETIHINKAHEDWVNYAYCFFNTRERTGLPYILHAPFILTPNREGIKEKRIENEQLIVHLGNLLTDAIDLLKVNNLLTIDFFRFFPVEDEVESTFVKIYSKLEQKIIDGDYIPTQDGRHISIRNAYVCSDPDLNRLLSFENYNPLRLLVNNGSANFVFENQKEYSPAVFNFIAKKFAKEQINGPWFAARISSQFLNQLPWKWYLSFIDFLAENEYLTKKDGALAKRDFIAVTSPAGPAFKAPFNEKGVVQLYLQKGALPSRVVVRKELLEYQNSMAVLKRFELRVPNEFDDLIHQVIPKYGRQDHATPYSEARNDFEKITFLLKGSSYEQRTLILEKLKESWWIVVKDGTGKQMYACPAKETVYLRTAKLEEYFSNSISLKCIDIQFYSGLENEIENISQTICLKIQPVIYEIKFDNPTIEKLRTLNLPYVSSTSTRVLYDVKMDGIENFIKKPTLSTSIFIASYLGSVDFSILKSRLEYSHYGRKLIRGESTLILSLKKNKWIFKKDGSVAKPGEVTLDDVNEAYSEQMLPFLMVLGITKNVELERLSNLSEGERAVIAIYNKAKNAGLSIEEIEAMIDSKLNEKRSKEMAKIDETAPKGLAKKWVDKALENISRKEQYKTQNGSYTPIPKTTVSDGLSEDNEGDDDLIPEVVNMTDRSRRIEEAKVQELTQALELEAKRKENEALLEQSAMYSFQWFNILLELEDSHTFEEKVKKNPIRVTFSKATFDNDGTLILSDTPFIPQSIEDVGALQVQFYTEDEQRTIEAEAVSPQKTSLKVKLIKPDALKGFDLSKINRAVVEVSSADFILEKLKTAFRQLPFKPQDNLHQLLPKPLFFIFGPPGTGKTTYLSWLIGGHHKEPLHFKNEAVTPFMLEKKKKVLVLAPTNKAADVLVDKIIQNHIKSNDASYQDWLVRFGETKSETILASSIFVKDRILSDNVYDQCTVVTTIARYPYDFFLVEGTDKNYISEYHWDYIVFDEASMINLASIIYVIYNSHNINPDVKFFIGGDPFQIHPVIKYEWPGWSYLPEKAVDSSGKVKLDAQGKEVIYRIDAGNIYSMVGLMNDNSFSNPKTTPHPYAVHNLIIQFRSIVPLGQLFSKYRYNGQLSHDRTPDKMIVNPEKQCKEISIVNLPLKALTFIHFPVKKFGGIFRARSVKGSPFQIYSAIFTVELIKYIAANSQFDTAKPYRIGVICPYKIQETIIGSLIKKIDCHKLEIVTGTVHGFQGDECEMIIAVFNPSAKITRGTKNFLNKKNIINVALSRARDKMIALLPTSGDNEVKIDDLHQLARVKSIAAKTDTINESLIEYDSMALENLFDLSQSIEDMCFPTTHQNVNIYYEALKRYEIRFDENAIDIQMKQEVPSKKGIRIDSSLPDLQNVQINE